MATQCCFAAHEPEQRPPFYPEEHCQRFVEGEGPDRMAAGANCDDDKMADDDETLRALDYIREMCLDRPCPNCKSEVIDKPQDDVRQCRGCGHVWGFDDTQNLEEFVREFARMEPCVVCDNDNLDEFEVVDNEGRQELICRNCQSVQRQDRVVEDYEVVHPDQEGGYGNPEFDMRGPRELACPFCPIMTDDFFEKQYEHGELVRAVCPSCSYVVYFKGQDDVRKAEENDVLMAQEDYRGAQGNADGWAREHNGGSQENNGRAQGNDVGWAQEHNGRAQGNDVGWAHQENNGRAHGNDVGWAHQGNNGRAQGNDGRWAQEGFDQGIRAPEDGINGRQRLTGRWQRRKRQDGEAGGNDDKAHFFQPVKRAMKTLCVKPIALARHALRECADSVRAEDETLAPRLRDMATTQGPIMAEQLGWTIGTAMGNVVFRTPEGAALTGNVGSIVGRGFCNMVLHTMCNRRRDINARDGGY